GQMRSRIGRVNADGSLDTGFNPGAQNDVNALALQRDGKIVAGGAFTTLGGVARSHIGRLTNDGAALQNLSVVEAGPLATVTWLRSGSGPEFSSVEFAVSTDGATYTGAISPARIAGGWQIAMQPPRLNIFVRARGFYGQSTNGASIVETVRS